MTQFTKLEVAIPTKAQVDKGLNIIRDQLALDRKRDELKEDKKSLHDIFDEFFEGIPNWVNEVWNSPGNNPMSNTHFDVNMFARAYCGMLGSPEYAKILEFTNSLAEGKDKATFTIWKTDKKAGTLNKVKETKDKRKWVSWLSTQFTNRVHLICDKERQKPTPTLTSEFNAAVKRMLKALDNEKFKGQKSAKHMSEMRRQIVGLQDYGINVTLK
jgi:hypothetical protein|tara:strand:- start:277 stop:918 length:642 start_codon:yes stop_codon:yes gene_type:complete